MKKWVLCFIAALAGCGEKTDSVTYVCEEPLDKYLALARRNIANDYAIERSTQVLQRCPEKGFHRRYRFSFPKRDLLSRQPVAARVTAAWCNDADEKETAARLTISSSTLTFAFDYPWSTPTGKYPRTEFRLNRNTLRGGFFDDLAWQCRLEQTAAEAL